MDLSRYPKPYGPDTIVIPMTMELPASFVAHMEAMSAPPPEPRPRPPRGEPPSPAVLAARWEATLAEAAAAETARRAWAPPSRAVIADVRGHPGLVLSGISDGEVTLWRRGSDAAQPQALAALTLDLDGSQLFAAGNFVGRLYETEGEALFLPDWLRQIGTDLEHGAAELLGVPEAQAQEEEEPARRLGPGGRELSPLEEILLFRFNQAIKELRQIDPGNREATSIAGPSYVPDEPTVLRVEAALREARIKAVIAETSSAKGDVQSKIRLTEAEAIDAGLKFAGPGYREIGRPGDGVFRSLDGRRQFRIDSPSLEGRHRPFVPHISFETIDPTTGRAFANNHVLIVPDARSR